MSHLSDRVTYDHQKTSQLLLSTLFLPQQAPQPTVMSTIDELVQRSLDAEGRGTWPGDGSLFTTISHLTTTRPTTLLKTNYEKINPSVTNQLQKMILIKNIMKQKNPDYFTLENLIAKFGEAEGKHIDGNVKTIEQAQQDKNFKHYFTDNSRNQPTVLEVYVLKRRGKMMVLPEIIINKVGKSGPSFAKKMAKYITKATPFLEDTNIHTIDAKKILCLYVAQPEETPFHDVAYDVLEEILDTTTTKQLIKAARKWEELDKKTTGEIHERKRKLEEYQTLYGKSVKNNTAKTDLSKRNQKITRAKQALKKARLDYQKIMTQTAKIVQKKIDLLSPEQSDELNWYYLSTLGGIDDIRGTQLIVENTGIEKVYKKRFKTSADNGTSTYIEGSFEDFAEDKHREVTIKATHAKHKTITPGQDPLELQLMTCDELVKDLFGLYNHTRYEIIKSEEIEKSFKGKQLEFYNNITEALLPISAALEAAYKSAYNHVRGRPEDITYEELLEQQAKKINILAKKVS